MAARATCGAAGDLYRPASAGRARVPPARPIVAWLGVVALRGLALLPYPVIYRLAGAVGRVGAWLPIRPVRSAAMTIRMSYPDLSARERARLLRRSMAESTRTVCELGAVWTWSRDRVLGLVREVHGAQHLEAAVAQGRGVVLLTPHLGAWELAGLYCSSRYPITALYKRPVDTVLERFYERGRARFGARLAPAGAGGIRALVRALSDGDIVVMMPDQDPRRGAGVFVPFFEVLANTTTLVSRLAQRSGAPVVLSFAERLPKGAGFRLHFRPASPAVRDGDLLASASALSCDIERLVRACPEQYLWSYKRFRIRPHGEANPYRPSAHAKTASP